MNDADFELLKAEALSASTAHNVAMAAAIVRIQHDLALMLEKVSRIESIMVPPGGWDRDDDIELSDPPF